MLQENLQQLKNRALDEIKKAGDLNQLRDLEIRYLGRKGELTKILRTVGELPAKERGRAGDLANQVKQALASEIGRVKKSFGEKGEGGVGEKEWIDVTASKMKDGFGHLNPVSTVQYELEDVFSSMGFMVLDGPELESDYYNFEALNIPSWHPARDMQDTFYVEGENLLMRTQTSAMQVRAMEKYGAPLRAIVPGRCFRNEATDARHEHTFYQLEGFMIDKNISFANLKAVLEVTAQKLYGKDTRVRLRPKYFPFVEPGVNGEVTCFLCKGKGCRLCKNTGWLEIFGAGMIHPNVLRAGGINPEKWSGFAFGFGLTRLAMLKYGIDDVRLFCGGDIRFLGQF
ncbi:phenylalanine--tRNA ligase subunit alpha [Candidatus Falkowbacteria bacterium]|nr:phenylalanine--tRNA ligase subunit alpha [Candidatus Falkowbacteria bacterium]